jgi:hypothetical protein
MKSSDDDSVRSRAIAGFLYFVCGGVVCVALLLRMHAGVTVLLGFRGGPVPIELIAGLAGIVAFMGLVQILIASILKMRGHQ